jgi:hypothetical protein
VVDYTPIPLAVPDDPGFFTGQSAEPVKRPRKRASHVTPSRSGRWCSNGLTVALCLVHALAIWWGLGGREGLSNGWPIWHDDHPLYYHSALVTRSFLKSSWTTAGYDPSFMAGYAKSVVFPSSSTLPELAVAVFGGNHPEYAYKIYVLASAAAVPWLIVLSCSLWRVPARGVALAVLLDLLYIWTDFPINYVFWGMVPYFLAIPVGLAGTAAFARFLTGGGPPAWCLSVGLLSSAFLIHFTTAMIVVPAAALAYVAANFSGKERSAGSATRSTGSATSSHSPRVRITTAPFHLAIWMIPTIVLSANAFWWLPGIFLASTKGESGFTFNHPEGVVGRLLQIVNSAGVESPVQSVLIAAGLPGLVLIYRRRPVEGMALAGVCAAGLFWGYLAGSWRALDFLQPGRHTYACYTALAIAGGAGLDEVLRRLRVGSPDVVRLDRWVTVGLLVLGIRMLGYPLVQSLRGRLAVDIEMGRGDPGGWPLMRAIRLRSGPGEPFLSSRPSPRLLWVIDRIGKHVRPGERLLYEEGGKGIAGVPDPFQGGRFSGLLPERTGIEVIGGPYLHASLKTNFTQFGEGSLFGRGDWDRVFFEKYAKLYRPSAILCWSPYARRFCRENPGLVQVVEDDGVVLIGRVLGFEGEFIEGSGRVEALPDRIRVHDLVPGLDGSVLLRYHSVPYLKTSPSVVFEREFREDDPVPFIRLRPAAGTRSVELEMQLPVRR